MKISDTLTIQVRSAEEKKAKEKPLQVLCDNLSSEALEFLAQISSHPNAQKKLLQNKIIITAFLK